MSALITLAIISAIITFVILMMGVMTIGKKGEENKKRSNKLMRLRIFFQFSTVALLLLAAAAA
ncbi:MAG: twin transmembrane helix small protein [Kordiimonadaceae bacterium]|nr:twin transmembrane helix small protein [Kordiimonadaceae bacterium]